MSQRPRTTFCWLPPGERAGVAVDAGRADVQRRRLLLRRGLLGGAPHEAGAGEAVQRRQAEVAHQRLVEQQRLALALLGRQAHAGADGRGDRAVAQARAVDVHRAGRRPPRPVHGLDDLGPAGADESGQTDDLAGADLEAHVGELAPAGEPLDLEHDRRALAHRLRRREDVLDGAPGHQADELGGRRLARRQAGRDRAAVLEDGHAVADLADLLEPVGDVDDRDALGGEVADDGEQLVDLAGVEHRGRLVHDDEARVVRQGARHADDLLAGRGQAPDLAPGGISGCPSRRSSTAVASRAAAGRSRPARLRSCPRKTFSATVSPSTRSSSW
jgi:hypothetical protein